MCIHSNTAYYRNLCSTIYIGLALIYSTFLSHVYKLICKSLSFIDIPVLRAEVNNFPTHHVWISSFVLRFFNSIIHTMVIICFCSRLVCSFYKDLFMLLGVSHKIPRVRWDFCTMLKKDSFRKKFLGLSTLSSLSFTLFD